MIGQLSDQVWKWVPGGSRPRREEDSAWRHKVSAGQSVSSCDRLLSSVAEAWPATGDAVCVRRGRSATLQRAPGWGPGVGACALSQLRGVLLEGVLTLSLPTRMAVGLDSSLWCLLGTCCHMPECLRGVLGLAVRKEVIIPSQDPTWVGAAPLSRSLALQLHPFHPSPPGQEGGLKSLEVTLCC